MILIEFMGFAANNVAIGVRGTSGTVLLIDWMDLSALTASQLREITRVLHYLARNVARPSPTMAIDAVRASILGICWEYGAIFIISC